MALSHADVLIHPLRMRIVTVIGQHKMTATEIARHLPGVPQASLYRNLATLVQANIVQIVETRPVRGAVEKVYALDVTAASLSAEELAQTDRAEHLRYFAAYTAMLTEHFRAYLEQEVLDYKRDGLSYRIAPLELSDTEFAEMAEAVRNALAPYVANVPAPNRRRRYLSFVLIPEAEKSEASSEESEITQGA